MGSDIFKQIMNKQNHWQQFWKELKKDADMKKDAWKLKFVQKQINYYETQTQNG